MAYNALGQRTQIARFQSTGTANPVVTTDFTYDTANRMVRRHDAVVLSYTPVTYWVYDEGTNPLLEYFGGNPLIQHRYVWSDNVDDLLADEQNPGLSSRNTLWALSDHLGSIRDIADTNESTGATSIANHRRYDSFGRRVWETNDAMDLVFGYTGKLFDETTRLQNNLNRWYDSSTGRWISQDPIGFAGGDANLYRYVGNKSTMATDPSGLQEDLPSDIVERLKELFVPPTQSWSEWWNGNTAYKNKISSVVDELVMLSDQDPFVLQLLMLEGGKYYSASRYGHMLGAALIQKQVSLLASQECILETTAYEILFARSREITGSYNYGTEMRLAAAHGSELGPMVAGVVIGMSLNPIRSANPNDVAFSQRTVNNNVADYTNDMKNNNWDWSKSGPVRVMWQGDRYVTYDNRRVMAAREAGVKNIPIEVVAPKAIRPGTKMTWEEAFRRRFNHPLNKKAGGAVPEGGLMECPTVVK
jgi:RHS repeat-associated protein